MYSGTHEVKKEKIQGSNEKKHGCLGYRLAMIFGHLEGVSQRSLATEKTIVANHLGCLGYRYRE